MYCFSKLCFVCLDEKNNLRNIKSRSPKNKQLIRKLEYFKFNMEMMKTSQDLLICQKCSANLQIAYDFMQMCCKNNKLIQSYVSLLKNATVYNTNIETRLNIVLTDVKHDYEDKYVLFLDATNKYNWQNSDESLSNADETDYSNFVKIEIEEHLTDKYLTNCVEIKEEPITDEDTRQSSINCDDKSLIKRMLTHRDDKNYACSICGKLFNRKSNLTRHILIHTNKTSEYNLENSNESVERYYQCTTCRKRFNRKSNLTRHLVIHTNENLRQTYMSNVQEIKIEPITNEYLPQYSTDDDSSGFTSNNSLVTVDNSLINTMFTHVAESYYECKICRKQFNRKSNLTRHMMIHSGRKQYSCSFCNKHCNDKSNFNRHMMSHTVYNNYTCSFCGLVCNGLVELKRHLLIHNGQNLYKCTLCNDKQWSSKTIYKQHMLLHSGEI